MKIVNLKKKILLVLFLTSVGTTFAQIKLPKLISNNLILQRDTDHKIWGWATNNEKVTLHFRGQHFKTTTNQDGKWEIKLPAQEAGGPYQMIFKASNSVKDNNILFGDVYLCSGQSNMELPMSRLSDTYSEEIKNIDNSEIRQFLVPDEYNFTEEKEDFSSGSWKVVNRENILDFSGIAYFFAKTIYEKEGVPIGLTNAALGGSPVSAWMDKKSLK